MEILTYMKRYRQFLNENSAQLRHNESETRATYNNMQPNLKL